MKDDIGMIWIVNVYFGVILYNFASFGFTSTLLVNLFNRLIHFINHFTLF